MNLFDIICQSLINIVENKKFPVLEFEEFTRGIGTEILTYSILGNLLKEKLKDIETLRFGNGNFIRKGESKYRKKNIDFIIETNDESFYLIEIKGPSSCNYIFGGANSQTSKIDIKNSNDKNGEKMVLLEAYNEHIGEKTKKSKYKEAIYGDSIWGDIIKLIEIVDYAKNHGYGNYEFYAMCAGYIQIKNLNCKFGHKCGTCIDKMLSCFSGKILSNYQLARIYPPLIWADCERTDNFYVVIFCFYVSRQQTIFIDEKIKENKYENK